PARPGRERDGQRRAGGVGVGRGGEQDGGVLGGQHAGAVEAGGLDSGEQAVPGGGRGDDPGGDAAVRVAGVADGGVLDGDAEAGQQLGQVVAVLVLLLLGQHDQAAALGDEGGHGVQLPGGEHGAAPAGGAPPAFARRVGDDQYVVVLERSRVERALGVRGDRVAQ